MQMGGGNIVYAIDRLALCSSPLTTGVLPRHDFNTGGGIVKCMAHAFNRILRIQLLENLVYPTFPTCGRIRVIGLTWVLCLGQGMPDLRENKACHRIPRKLVCQWYG